jgi:TonB dependent receptor
LREQLGGGVFAFKGSSTLEDFFAGLPSDGSQLLGNPNVLAISKGYGVFFQDDWRIKPRIMLNLGLRWEYNSPFQATGNNLVSFDPAVDPTYGLVQQGQPGVGSTLIKPDYKNFSPRVGFAWDVTGKGTTVVRGGAGIFYSKFTVAPFTGNPGIANTPNTGIATIPTGACNMAVPIGGTCAGVGGQTLGGTIRADARSVGPAGSVERYARSGSGAERRATEPAYCTPLGRSLRPIHHGRKGRS